MVDFSFNAVGQVAQNTTLYICQMTWSIRYDTEGADAIPVAGSQWSTCIKPDVRVPSYKGVVGKTSIKRGVGNLKDIVAEDGVATEGDAATCLTSLQPLA